MSVSWTPTYIISVLVCILLTHVTFEHLLLNILLLTKPNSITRNLSHLCQYLFHVHQETLSKHFCYLPSPVLLFVIYLIHVNVYFNSTKKHHFNSRILLLMSPLNTCYWTFCSLPSPRACNLSHLHLYVNVHFTCTKKHFVNILLLTKPSSTAHSVAHSFHCLLSALLLLESGEKRSR